MPTPPAPPTEAEVLEAIAELLAARPSAAALAHYPTLRIQTTKLRDALLGAIGTAGLVVDEWATELARDDQVASEFHHPGSTLFAYRKIAPALVRNVNLTADFLLEETRPTPAVDIDRVSETAPSFSDFSRLGAAVRGFLDALVQTTYQLVTFDGLQLNYKFLQSLLSFATVAPASLHTNIVSAEIQSALDAYMSLSGRDRKNSAFTKAAHEQFPQRLLVGAQAAGLSEQRRRNLELLFSFCSDFVHSGYVSVLAVGEPSPGFILGGPGDAFTPKAENYAELKQRLLSECAGAYSDLLLPVLRQAIGRTLAAGLSQSWTDKLDQATNEVGSVRTILERKLVEPVRRGLLGSNALVEVGCMCGQAVELQPPHEGWDQYCLGCGSRFIFQEVGDEVDYVISANGIGDVLGGDATKIADLSEAARDKLKRIASKHAPEDSSDEVKLLLITDLDRCDEESLRAPSIITSAPSEADRGKRSILAFVAAKAMERCPAVRITCNCGASADYNTAEGTNIIQCPRCGTGIGLLSVAGDGDGVPVRNPDGSSRIAPIQARDRFSIPGTAVDYPKGTEP